MESNITPEIEVNRNPIDRFKAYANFLKKEIENAEAKEKKEEDK